MPEWMIDFFSYFVIVYSAFVIFSYISMALLAYLEHRQHYTYHDDKYTIEELRHSPYTPGISIVAPAYNEEKTVITNVSSLLSLDYPDFEVVIVNDGSKDKTLELLIENFDLVKVPYAYIEKIKTKPFKGLYKTKSDNPAFKRLTVVDKVNGGTKADASNAGVNVVSNKYFVCTDVDCVLDKYALYRIIWPTMSSNRRVIAVSATMRMSNGSIVENGQMVETHPPHSLIPLFQDLEYTRSFLIGKTALSRLNAMQNVSGGFGMFDREVVIRAGGYDGDSFAEDMDMVARMIRYMCDAGEDYTVVQIPETCCWTEGPPNFKVLNRQRTRWGRGLFQFFTVHRDMVFNKNYRQYGLLTLPYILIFELLAPVIEFSGYIMVLWLLVNMAINWHTIWIAFLGLYVFAQALTTVIVAYDLYVGTAFKRKMDYLWFFLASMLEPIMYHPINVFFSIRGYIKQMLGTQMVWGNMTRKGVQSAKPAAAPAGTTAPAVESTPQEKPATPENTGA
ncbi:MAG: glycosyltransferase family 2 protein [Bacteroidales bacterium]|nr:glycosyltransferase family 2 protein [Bacteroidales bacterium]